MLEKRFGIPRNSELAQRFRALEPKGPKIETWIRYLVLLLFLLELKIQYGNNKNVKGGGSNPEFLRDTQMSQNRAK